MRSSYFYVLAWTITSDLLLIGPGSPYVLTNLVIVFNFACLQCAQTINLLHPLDPDLPSHPDDLVSAVLDQLLAFDQKSEAHYITLDRANWHPRARGRRHPHGYDRDYARTLAPLSV